MVWQCVLKTKNVEKSFRERPGLREMIESGEAFTFDEATREALKETSVNLQRMPNEDYSVFIVIHQIGKKQSYNNINNYEEANC